jgi:hypothetical protein
MTTVLKTKIVRKRTVKLKVIPKLPANTISGPAISVAKSNGIYTIGTDYSLLAELTSFDPTQERVLIYNPTTEIWNVVSLANLVNNATATTEIITAGSSYQAGANDKLILVNKIVGSATAIQLPLSSLKVGPVRVVDFKGDANTNKITVSATGSDTFNGGFTSWTISGGGASVLFTPVSGIGYAVS